MTKRAPTLPALLLATASAACSANYLSVTVTAANPPASLAHQIVQLSVTAFDAASADGGPILLPPDGPMDAGLAGLPDASLTFTVQAPALSDVTVLVQGLDSTGAIIAARLDSSVISSKGNHLNLVLEPHCASDRDCDPNAFCSGKVFCGPAQFCEARSAPTPPDAGTPCGPGANGTCGPAPDAGLACLLADCGCLTPLADGGGPAFQFDPSLGEQCDDGFADSGAALDGGPFNSDTLPDHCRTNCRFPHCGDGVLDPDAGEICDLDAGHNGFGLGCNATCDLFGIVTTVAGRPNDAGLTDGVGAGAQFEQPYGIALLNGKLYIADTYSKAIRQVDPRTWQVITIAGGDMFCSDRDGQGDAGTFCDVNGILAYDAGLLVTDDSALRYVTVTGDVTTWAGQLAQLGTPPTGVDAGPFASALYGVPHGITSIGQVVYTTTYLDGRVLASDPASNLVTILASIGAGPGQSLELAGVVAVNGLLYVAIASVSGSIVVLDPVAMTQQPLTTDPTATLNIPDGVCTDGRSLYICEAGANQIRQWDLDAGGPLRLLAGPGAGDAGQEQDGTGRQAGFNSPRACVFDHASRTLYVTDKFGDTLRAIH